ncbi:SCO family protein [Salicola sp. Rm-C-2C1-2]|uniref:SCO family protein n=1 Tax=Salicola sp. Rm-C-2C1-2 TaxID=3141321 RepID=UPI0032E3DE6F
MTGAIRVLGALVLLLALAGCSNGDTDWNAKSIKGLMPDLAFSLTATDGEPFTPEDKTGQVRLLFFGFTNCPDICPATMARLQKAVDQMPEGMQDEVTLLFVSVDPKRDTPERIGQFVDFFGDNIVGLTSDEQTLRTLAKRYRTTFGYGKPDDDGNYAVSHSSAVYVFDGQGRARLLIRSDQSVPAISEDLETLVRQQRG